METDVTAAPTMWDELHQLARMGADYEKAAETDRARLAEKVDAAIDSTRKLERELEEIRGYLDGMTQ